MSTSSRILNSSCLGLLKVGPGPRLAALMAAAPALIDAAGFLSGSSFSGGASVSPSSGGGVSLDPPQESEEDKNKRRGERKDELRKLVLSALEFNNVTVKQGREFDPIPKNPHGTVADDKFTLPTPWVSTYPRDAKDTRAWMVPYGIFTLQTIEGFNLEGDHEKLQIFLRLTDEQKSLPLAKKQEPEFWKTLLRDAAIPQSQGDDDAAGAKKSGEEGSGSALVEVIKNVKYNGKDVHDVLDLPIHVMDTLKAGIGHKLLDSAKFASTREDDEHWQKVFSILRRFPEMANFSANGTRYTALMQAATQHNFEAVKSLVNTYHASKETVITTKVSPMKPGLVSHSLRSLANKLSPKVRSFLFPEDHVKLTFDSSYDGVNRGVSVPLGKEVAQALAGGCSQGRPGPPVAELLKIEVQTLQELLAAALSEPSVKILHPTTNVALEKTEYIDLCEVLDTTSNARPVVVVQRQDDQEQPQSATTTPTPQKLTTPKKLLYILVVEGYDDKILRDLRNKPYDSVTPSTEVGNDDNIMGNITSNNLRLTPRWNAQGSRCSNKGARGGRGGGSGAPVPPAEGVDQSQEAAGAAVPQKDEDGEQKYVTEETHLQNLETMGVVVTMKGNGESSDPFYTQHEQKGSIVYEAEDAVYLPMYAEALRKLFPRLADFGSTEEEAEAIFEDARQRLGKENSEIEEIFNTRANGITKGRKNLAMIPKKTWIRSLKDIVEKLHQAVVRDHAKGDDVSEKNRVQVIFNVESSGDLAQPYKFSDIATVITFGMTFQIGNLALKRLLMRWQSTAATAVDELTALGPNPFILSNEKGDGRILLQSEMTSAKSATTQQLIADNRAMLSGVMPLLGAMFSDPELSAWEAQPMHNAVIVGVNEKFLPGSTRPAPYHLKIISSAYIIRENAEGHRVGPNVVEPNTAQQQQQKSDNAIADPFKKLGEIYKNSEKHPAHVVLFYNDYPLKVNADEAPSATAKSSGFGPKPGQFLAAMTHFADMKRLRWASFAQLRTFFEALLSEEEFQDWEKRRVDKYRKAGMPYDRLYPEDQVEGHVDAGICQAGGARRLQKKGL
ncbi:unnamed protein product [Amoebophrya sp. A25]|nr:unnamed protein product [Amoebophrya sp. A25]|eukprot:GSA25T00026775001.1